MGDLTWIKERNLRVRPGSRVHLRHPVDGVIVGSGIVEPDKDDPSLLLQRLHNYSLEEHQEHAKGGEQLVGIRWLMVHQKYLGLPYPYSFCGIEVPDQISVSLVNGIHAWDLNSMEVEGTERKRDEEEGARLDVVDGDDDDADAGDLIEGVPDEVSLEEYDISEICVRVDQLVPPENQTRRVSSKHVAKLRESFSREGFTRRKGIISVARAPSWCDKVLAHSEKIFENVPVPSECASLCKQIETNADGSQLVPAFAVIDGLHRHTACIGQVCEEPQPAHYQSCAYFKVDLWTRKDKKEITNCEILSLGSFLNRSNEVVAVPSFADNVHLCISFLREIVRLNPGKKLTAATVGRKFTARDLLENKSKETHTRYARIAMTFNSSRLVYGRFISLWNKKPCFLLSHFTLKTFHQDFKRFEQLVLLDSIHAYQTHASESGGRFASPADKCFYEMARSMFDKMAEYATRLGISLSTFFDINIEKTSTGSCDVRLAVTRQMARFKADQNERQIRSNCKRLVTLLARRIENKFFPDFTSVSKNPSHQPSRALSSRTRRATEVVDLTTAISAPQRKRKTPPSNLFHPVAKKGRRSVRSTQKKKSPSQEKGRTSSSSSSSSSEEVEYELEIEEVTDIHPQKTSVKKPYNHPASIYVTADGFRLAMVKREEIESGDEKDADGDTGDSDGAPVQDYFEDSVPKAIPLGGTERSEHSSENSDWVENACVPLGLHKSVDAGGDALVLHPTAWLHKLGVPNGHRAHYLLSVQHLETIHRMVYRKASKNFLDEEGVLQNIRGIGEQQLNTEQLLAKYPMASVAYFSQKRQELDEVGVCELKNFLRTAIDIPRLASSARPIDVLFDYVMGKFPGEDKLADEENRTVWSPIIQVNTGRDAELILKGKGRYTTLSKALSHDIEQVESRRPLVFAKAYLETLCAQMVCAMRLERDGAHEDKLQIPRTGIRILTSGKRAVRQIPHMDFSARPAPSTPFTAASNIDYSVVCTGKNAHMIWGYDGSHKYMNGPKGVTRLLARSLCPRRVDISPYSVLIFRGDYLHSGPSGKDLYRAQGVSPTGQVELVLRAHLYFARTRNPQPENTAENRNILDAIHFHSGFRPLPDKVESSSDEESD